MTDTMNAGAYPFLVAGAIRARTSRRLSNRCTPSANARLVVLYAMAAVGVPFGFVPVENVPSVAQRWRRKRAIWSSVAEKTDSGMNFSPDRLSHRPSSSSHSAIGFRRPWVRRKSAGRKTWYQPSPRPSGWSCTMRGATSNSASAASMTSMALAPSMVVYCRACLAR